MFRPKTFSLAGVLVAVLTAVASAQSQPPETVPYRMELPPEVRAWYRNPDGSCVQCSIGMCGIWQNVPVAYCLLWDTPHGSRVRGGSTPSRVESYARARNLPIYNVTGDQTFDWMRWAAVTGRFAAIGAGTRHFQTLYGLNPSTNTWYVCNNNSPTRVDAYSNEAFRRLHLASGRWCVIIDAPPSPANPCYVAWWQ